MGRRGEAWGRPRPTCFSGYLLTPARKFRIVTTFVLSRLLHGAELWRASVRELRPMKKFYNRCVRAMAGHNMWSLALKHVHDADLRRRMGAPHFQQLLDRAALRWAGHCARLGSGRLPVQLLMGEVPAWGHRSQHGDLYRHRRRIQAALRRCGIDDTLFFDAADADRWRARLRRGWRRQRGARVGRVVAPRGPKSQGLGMIYTRLFYFSREKSWIRASG